MLHIISPLNASASTGVPSSLMSLAPFFVILGVMYFLIIRPQNKRAQEHKKLIAALKRGDRVVVLGGVMGVITKVIDDNELEIESAGSTFHILKSSVNHVTSKPEPRTVKADSKAAKLKAVKKK